VGPEIPATIPEEFRGTATNLLVGLARLRPILVRLRVITPVIGSVGAADGRKLSLLQVNPVSLRSHVAFCISSPATTEGDSHGAKQVERCVAAFPSQRSP
jgi:hypothetical protein